MRSQRRDGTYQPPEPVSFSDGTWQDVDPAVAPDESFAVFASGRPPTSAKNVDLFIVVRTGGRWGEPRHLGTSINTPLSDAEPRLGRGGHTLYFSSERSIPTHFPRTRAQAEQDLARTDWDTGNYNIFRVDLTPWLAPRILSHDVESAGPRTTSRTRASR